MTRDDLTEPEPLVDRREVGLQPLDQRQGAIADRTHPRLAHDTVAERLDRRFEIGLFTLDNRHIRLAPRERLLDHVSVRVGRAKFSERPVGADVSHRPLGLADNSGEPRGVVAAAKADDVAGWGSSSISSVVSPASVTRSASVPRRSSTARATARAASASVHCGSSEPSSTNSDGTDVSVGPW